MGKLKGFLEIDRLTEKHDPIEERRLHFKEFIHPLTRKEAAIQASRCMDCGTPFCTYSCPLHNVAPDFNNAVYEDKWLQAYEILSATNNFPEFTSRICPALCENGCILNFTGTATGVRSIERAIITHAFNQGWVKPKPATVRSGKSVAVIGSGPSGLACAQQLARAGHSVTVFEKNARPGGLLRFGIPDFKLSKDLIDRRIEQMQAEGVHFRCNTIVGSGIVPRGVWSDATRVIAAGEILRDFDAVVLAIGSEEPRDLAIAGRELKGVHFALEYLNRQTRINANDTVADPIDAKGKHVLVIGGGDTGSDCLGTAIRQGAADVLQIDLMPKPPVSIDKAKIWPDWPNVLRTSSSQEEGGKRDWCIMSQEFVGNKSNQVKSVKAVRIQWIKDENGRFKPEPIAGSEFTIKADLVLLAMGFLHPNSNILKAFGVQTDAHGNAKATYDTQQAHRTNVEKVFACGDCRRGQSLVVRALAEGRACANAVNRYLADN